MKVSFSLDRKLILLVMVVSVVALSITAYLSFSYADEILKERAGEQLIGESNIRGNTIKLLLEARIEQNKILATDPMIRILVSELNSIDNDDILNQRMNEKRRDFLTQVQAFQELVGFSIGLEDVKIVGKDGTVFFSLGKISDRDYSNDPLVKRGLEKSFVEFEPVSNDGKRMVVVSPIFPQDQNKNSEPIGVIISRMRTSAIDEILLNRSGLGDTGEVYLVNEKFLMLSESRFLDNAIFNQRVMTVPAIKCFEDGKDHFGFYPDYRNVMIYGSSFCAKELGFVLIAEINESEVTRPIEILQNRILQTGLLITTAMAIVAFVLSRRISEPLIKLKNAANKIADGNFDVRTSINTRDEIGELSHSFDSMAKRLQESLREIRQKEDVIKQQEEILLNFSDHSENDCVCFIDIKDSTKITGKLTDSQSSKLYSLFLNSMASIVRSYGGIVVKNIGDALLFYFRTPDPSRHDHFQKVLDCCLAMAESHEEINKKLSEEDLPSVNYKISATYGSVRVAHISKSEVNDIFGSTVNRCAKINPHAPTNGCVIGESLYKIVKNFKGYHFTKITDDILEDYGFAIYALSRKG